MSEIMEYVLEIVSPYSTHRLCFLNLNNPFQLSFIPTVATKEYTIKTPTTSKITNRVSEKLATQNYESDKTLFWRGVSKLKGIAAKNSTNFKPVTAAKEKLQKTFKPSSINPVDYTITKPTKKIETTVKTIIQTGKKQKLILVRVPSDWYLSNMVACFGTISEFCNRSKGITFEIRTYHIPNGCMNSLMSLLCFYFIARCYVNADKIFLKSARQWEMDIMFIAVFNKREYREQCLDILIEVAITCYIAAFTNINVLEGLKNTATSITETAATNTATLGIESAAQVVGNAVAGAAISAIVDVAVSSASIYIAKRQKDEGRMTEKEFSTKVKKTVCESSLKFVGGTTGSILGQVFIPVPVVGAFVGGFCGSLIGAGIGKGINYGIFDRNVQKEQSAGQTGTESSRPFRLYKRQFHGYIPKITIYNEKEKRFSEKSFEKSRNFLWRDNTRVDKSKPKDNEKVDPLPFLTRWKLQSQGQSSKDSKNKTSADTSVKSEQNSVLQKWKLATSSVLGKNGLSRSMDENLEASEQLSVKPALKLSKSCDGALTQTAHAEKERSKSPFQRFHESFKRSKNNKLIKTEPVFLPWNDDDNDVESTDENITSKQEECNAQENPRGVLFPSLSLKSIKDTFRTFSTTVDEDKKLDNQGDTIANSCEIDYNLELKLGRSASESTVITNKKYFTDTHHKAKSFHGITEKETRVSAASRKAQFYLHTIKGSTDTQGNSQDEDIQTDDSNTYSPINQMKSYSLQTLPKLCDSMDKVSSNIENSKEKRQTVDAIKNCSANSVTAADSFGERAREFFSFSKREQVKESEIPKSDYEANDKEKSPVSDRSINSASSSSDEGRLNSSFSEFHGERSLLKNADGCKETSEFTWLNKKLRSSLERKTFIGKNVNNRSSDVSFSVKQSNTENSSDNQNENNNFKDNGDVVDDSNTQQNETNQNDHSEIGLDKNGDNVESKKNKKFTHVFKHLSSKFSFKN